jgi:hypothetical protein
VARLAMGIPREPTEIKAHLVRSRNLSETRALAIAITLRSGFPYFRPSLAVSAAEQDVGCSWSRVQPQTVSPSKSRQSITTELDKC